MRQNVAKADLGAPASNNWMVGQILDEDALHGNLAKANLLRLRGDYAEAEKICLDVLAAHPDSAPSHTLLGDIAFSQDKADQAVHHYEIAYSLEPNSIDLRRKLQDATALRASHESVNTVDQLGLPSNAPVPWSAIGFGAFAAIAVGALVMVGLALAPRSPHVSPPSAPIVATQAMTVKPSGTKTAYASNKGAVTTSEVKPTETTQPVETASSTPAVTSLPLTAEDQNLLQTIQSKSAFGSHLQTLSSSPRDHSVVLTFSYGAGEDPRKVGAELAKDVLDQSGDTLSITVRGVRDQKLDYMADVPRTKYADTMTDTWRTANPGEDSWIGYVLTNEWPYRSAETPKAP